MIMMPRAELSLAEFESLTGVSRASIYRLIARGELRTVQRGRRRLVPSAELERLCNAESEVTA
jgi:excisionase family DNA binding protein